MECGEFDKRNKEFEEQFNKESYFQRLLLNDSDLDSTKNTGEGKIIFDVGAHSGESASFFNTLFPQAKIYSFEPIPEMVSKIRELNISNHVVEEIALSNFDGVENFNVQDISHLSSLHKVNKDSEQSLGYHLNESHRTIEVDVMRGDSYIKQKGIEAIDLLKMDVQANEVNTLEGFSDCVHLINALLVEVSFYDFYEIKSSIGSIENNISDFELYDIYEVSKNPKTMGTDWASLVYINKHR